MAGRMGWALASAAAPRRRTASFGSIRNRGVRPVNVIVNIEVRKNLSARCS